MSELNLVVDGEDVPIAGMPQRSRLYSLPMKGTCGATQESIVDYAQRLSIEHCIKPRDFFRDILLPEAGMRTLVTRTSVDASSLVRCNGTSKYASDLVAALERLTGRKDLAAGTFTRWKGLLGTQIGISPIRRWCPDCLSDSKSEEGVIFSLIWSMIAVRVCPIHRSLLYERCIACHRTQPIVGSAHIRGHCSTCGNSLCQAASRIDNFPPTSRDRYMAEAASDLVAAKEGALELADLSLAHRRVQEAADRLSGGSTYKLAKALGITRGAFHRNAFSLVSFLDLLYRLNVKPMPFLSGTAKPEINEEAIPFARALRRSQDYEEQMLRLRHQFQVVAADESQPCSISRLCAQAGVSCPSMRYHFPELIKQIATHSAAIRSSAQAAKTQSKMERIRQAMESIVAGGSRPTSLRIQRALRAVGLDRRDPKVRKAADGAVAEIISNHGLPSTADSSLPNWRRHLA